MPHGHTYCPRSQEQANLLPGKIRAGCFMRSISLVRWFTDQATFPLPPAGSSGPGTQRLQRSWNESIKAAASGPTRASSRSTKDAPSRSNSVPRQASGTIQSWKSGARSSPYLTKRHWYNHRPFGKEKNDYPERPLVRGQSRVSPARDSGRRYPVVFHTLVWSSLAGGYAAIGSRCWPASAAVVCPGHEMHPGLPR
jgi:hypothetical protein